MNTEEQSTKESLKAVFARFVCFLKVDLILLKTSNIFVKILFVAGIVCFLVNHFTGIQSRLLGYMCFLASLALFIMHLDINSFFRHMALNRRYFSPMFEKIVFLFPLVAFTILVIELIK